jgi:hypothetical protein
MNVFGYYTRRVPILKHNPCGSLPGARKEPPSQSSQKTAAEDAEKTTVQDWLRN